MTASTAPLLGPRSLSGTQPGPGPSSAGNHQVLIVGAEDQQSDAIEAAGGDQVAGDQASGDQVAGDQVAGDQASGDQVVEGDNQGDNEGYNQGDNEGYNQGYNEGYNEDEDYEPEIQRSSILSSPISRSRGGWRHPILALALGQLLALLLTASGVLTTLLVERGINTPAFQMLFMYIVVAGGLTLLVLARPPPHGGPARWRRLLRADGWRFVVLALLDVEGNYFTVLAYRHTNIMSIQLISFSAIACAFFVPAVFLRVRYGVWQVVGIVASCAGVALLIVSDRPEGKLSEGDMPDGIDNDKVDRFKGNMFALIGAVSYGLSNLFEEWMVSGRERDAVEVVSFMAIFGTAIMGAQALALDGQAWRDADDRWDRPAIGYLAGYTVCLALFFVLVPVLLSRSGTVFFQISLLTSAFWGAAIGTCLFGYPVGPFYPVAFVLVIAGLVAYFLAPGGRIVDAHSTLGAGPKPELGGRRPGGVVEGNAEGRGL